MRDGGERSGVACAVAAFLMWGLFPLYWKQLPGIGAIEIVSHRTAWSLASLAVFITLTHRWRDALAVVRRGRTLAMLATSAALIAANWSTYIWAVTHDRVVEASLGYYVNPLVNVLLGVLVLKEHLSRLTRLAVALATTAVAVLTIAHGRFPWVALALAVTFGLYGLVRKTVAADSVTGLAVETALLSPAALAYLAVLGAHGTGAFGQQPLTTTLLVLAGPVTAVPLVLFAAGARRLPLSTVGLIQYISPTCQLMLGVLLYHEPFTPVHAAVFACIWVALGLLSWDLRARLAVTAPAAEA